MTKENPMSQTAAPSVHSVQEKELNMGALFASLWRKKAWIVLGTLFSLACAVLYLTATDPKFKADTRILIEQRESVFTRPNSNGTQTQTEEFNELSIGSQVEILQSRDLLNSVAEKLKLDQIAEFNPDKRPAGQAAGGFATLFGLLPDNEQRTASTQAKVVTEMRERLEVYQLAQSRVIAIEFQSESPKLAADVANTIAEEYMSSQRDARRNTTAGASKFLETEIATLRGNVTKAERSVEEFRASADLFSGTQNSSLVRQQLSETLSQLGALSAQAAEANAKAQQIRALINSGKSLATSSDVQQSPLIQSLREQQVALRAQITELQTTFLANHPQILSTRSQLADLEQEINKQASLIARALEGDAEVAATRQRELQQRVAQLKAESARANESEIKLRALEREARAQRDLLDTYLTRFQEASARQSGDFLPINARVISRAAIPAEVFFPKNKPIMAIAALAGVIITSLLILITELASGRAFQTIAMHEIKPVETLSTQKEKQPQEPVMRPLTAEENVSLALKSDVPLTQAPHIDPVADVLPNDVLKQAVSEAITTPAAPTEPESTVRQNTEVTATTVMLDNKLEQAVVISMSSDKSAADWSLSFARLLAHSGRKAALVDINMHNLPQQNNKADKGFAECILAEADLESLLIADHQSSLHIMTAGNMNLPAGLWSTPIIDDTLDDISDIMSTLVVHANDSTQKDALYALAERAEILIFAMDNTITEQDARTKIQTTLGYVPRHSMFVTMDVEDTKLETAA